MPPKGPTMSRFALLVWVLSPLLVIGALALMMDRTKGKADPRLNAIAMARLPGQSLDSSRPQAQLDAEVAATLARKTALERSTDPTLQPPAPAPAAPAGKLVQPESLEQGFIILVNDKSQISSNESPIYIASSHNGWNPSDQAMKLSRRSDMRWQLIFSKPTLDSKLAFKFTRGSWDLVECEESGADVENRLLPLVDLSRLPAGEKPVIELTVQSWQDKHSNDPARAALSPYHPIKVGAGTVKRVEVTGGGGVTAARDLLVWLPPGYDDAANASRRYPVLYMQDGQNLFQKLPNIPAEWGADETAAKLIEEKKIEPLIIVGIPNAGAARMSEYVPIAVYEKSVPQGKAYIAFLTSEVKPRIDALFRTKPDAANTGIGGASLGGVISIEAATERPDVFGKVLSESTPMLANNRALFRHFGNKKTWPTRFYFGMGGKEDPKDPAMSEQYTSSAAAFGELLKGKGFSNDSFKLNVDSKAEHNEQAWAKRLPAALQFLFPFQAE